MYRWDPDSNLKLHMSKISMVYCLQKPWATTYACISSGNITPTTLYYIAEDTPLPLWGSPTVMTTMLLAIPGIHDPALGLPPCTLFLLVNGL